MSTISNETEISENGDFSMGTLYDLNKEAYNKVMPYTKEQQKENLGYIYDWIVNKDCKYLMLLCKERSDYTIFNFQEQTNEKYKRGIMTDLKECLSNRGVLLDIRYVQESDAWEIWMRAHSESFMFMLFECNDFVIEV